MILESIKYIRLEGEPKEWGIIGHDENAVRFGNINLVVGKNATGKSRTISVIKEIAYLLSGSLKLQDVPFSKFEYQLVLKNESDIYEYKIKVENKSIEQESLYFNKEPQIIRTKSKGQIFSNASNSMEFFELDPNLLMVEGYRTKDYPFILKLNEWGCSLKNGSFSNQLEKNYHAGSLSNLDDLSKNIINITPAALLTTFWQGKHLFGDRFVDDIKKDMLTLQYSIDKIDILKGGSGYSIYVKEKELDDFTSQTEMSQGMFRLLSFIIRLNMALLSKESACILVDDIGEGLDFDRSSLLMNMIVEKIQESNIQMFITTNDRYIMNKIPIEYWSVIERKPKVSVFYNYYNSRKIFDDFKFTGLNNFDFLTTDFYLKGFDDIA